MGDRGTYPLLRAELDGDEEAAARVMRRAELEARRAVIEGLVSEVACEELGVEDRMCGICQQDFEEGSPGRWKQEDGANLPVRLPCRHVFGKECLMSWLMENSTCPYCRAEVTDLALGDLLVWMSGSGQVNSIR